jgi:hypothetical protein
MVKRIGLRLLAGLLATLLLGTSLRAAAGDYSFARTEHRIGSGVQVRSAPDTVTLGQAALAARLNLYTNSLVHRDLIDTYHLLGDPALRIALPPPEIKVFLPYLEHN